MEPWDTHHQEAHDKAVYRLTEARGNLAEAAGWIGILPETSAHLTAMLEAIIGQLGSVLRQVDRPTILEDYDNRVNGLDDDATQDIITGVEQEADEADEVKVVKVFHLDDHGDMR